MKPLPLLRSGVFPPLAACLLLAVPPAAPGQNLDLPFDSGSTGEDGELVFGEIGLGGYSFALAYDPVRAAIVRMGGVRTKDSLSAIRTTQQWRSSTWSTVTSTTPAFDRGLTAPAMAFDEARGELILFGGLHPGNMQYSASYSSSTYVLTGSSWVDKSASASGRAGHAMAYDAARQEIVFFGGTNSSGLLSDTRVWNGTSWASRSPATSPPARTSHVMAYDREREEVVLFGGMGASSTRLGDTWAWDGANWTPRTPANSPEARDGAAMAFDAARGKTVLFGGRTASATVRDTWTWDGVNWTLEDPATKPSARRSHGMAYDSVRQRVVMAHGTLSSVANEPPGQETWEWDGTNWTLATGISFTFDLRSKPEAVWHFTRIRVDDDVTVTFQRNAANTSVVWLASEDVTIAGNLVLDGADASTVGTSGSGTPPPGGPGGFAGGRGGGATSGIDPTAGEGPGGGAAGDPDNGDGGHAVHVGAYGSAFAIPLVGGSGGGGGGAGTSDGFKGGSGGGAILIASSRDITLTGTISARAGARGGSGGTSRGGGGHGSGGTVRLVADRILASSGAIDTTANPPGQDRDGRVRLEGYVRQFNPATIKGSTSAGAPVLGDLLQQAAGRLFITQVAGQGVGWQPEGNTVNPDVVFSEPGEISVTVQAMNIPNGTPVTLTILHHATGATELPAVPLANGQATFTATVATGTGTLQAFSTHQVGGQ